MKTLNFQIDNLKCGGCESTIKERIQKFEGIEKVTIDNESSEVEIQHSGELLKDEVLKALARLGYPEKGTTNAFQTAKSYVSCAVGKVSNKVAS